MLTERKLQVPPPGRGPRSFKRCVKPLSLSATFGISRQRTAPSWAVSAALSRALWGVHFVNPALLMDGALDATQPEALIYEFKDGVARLVGVEFTSSPMCGT